MFRRPHTTSFIRYSRFASAGLVVMLVGALLIGAGVPTAQAADLVQVEMLSGQVMQGRLVGTTQQAIWLAMPGRTDPMRVNRVDLRRLTVLGAERPEPSPANGPRLPVADRLGTVRFAGASSMGADLVPALLEEYGREAGLTGAQEEITTDPGLRVLSLEGAESARRLRAQIATRGSAETFADLFAGRADIGMSTRHASEAELRSLMAGAAGAQARTDVEQVIGLSGLAIIVHRGNPVRALSVSQLRGIFTGLTTQWSAVGGASSPITVHALDRRSGEYELLQERVLGFAAHLTAQAKVYPSLDDVADAVAADPSAIGFVEIGGVRNARPLALEQECGLRGVVSPFQLRTEEYPLSGRLYLYASRRAGPVAIDLMRFAAAPRAQAVIGAHGFVDLEPILASAEESAAQLESAGRILPAELREAAGAQAQAQAQSLRQILGGARRLSVTFRFDAGRADLDARAEGDLERLIQWLGKTRTSPSAVILIGHASPEGMFGPNVDLSRLRAQAVALRLARMGVTVARVEGVGPVNQVLCGLGVTENDMNRRVEVWIR